MSRHAFDSSAARYDTDFTTHRLGRSLRSQVQHYLGEAFRPGSHVLELGCGTGEDAVWLALQNVRVTAVDASDAMLDVARRKAERAGTADRISFARLDLSATELRIGGPGGTDAFDGAFSSFGVLNCLPERRHLAQVLAERVRPGGRFLPVVMGRFCPWEVVAFLLRGRIRQAFRRMHQGREAPVGGGAAIPVWYVSPRQLRREFAPWFRPLTTVGVGVLLPPTDFRHLVDRWPRLFDRVEALDRRIAPIFPSTWLNDHHLTIFERC